MGNGGIGMAMWRAAVAGSVAILCSSVALAEPQANGPDAAFAPPHGLNPGTQQPQPLMSLLDRTGIGGALEDANIRLFGHVEGSYTYNVDDPADDLNLGRVFDLKHDRPTLNQLDFNIERPVDLTSHHWDFGGRIEMLYGSDAR